MFKYSFNSFAFTSRKLLELVFFKLFFYSLLFATFFFLCFCTQRGVYGELISESQTYQSSSDQIDSNSLSFFLNFLIHHHFLLFKKDNNFLAALLKPQVIYKSANQIFPSHKNVRAKRSTKQSHNSEHFLNEEFTQEKEIDLFGFDQFFVLNLKSIRTDEFLSSNINFLNKENAYAFKSTLNLTSPYAIYDDLYLNRTLEHNCFYVGHVNSDLLNSFAHINLCHKGHMVNY